MRTFHACAAVLTGAVFLAGCGGGGGTREAPPPSPPPPPPPTTCQDPEAENTGGPLPCRYSHQDHHLTVTGAEQAHAQGVLGDGVRVGSLDTTRSIGPYGPLVGQVAHYRDHTGTTSQPGDAAYGHGDTTAAILLGRTFGAFPGGVAPGATLYWAAVCNHLGCLPDWHAAGVADLASHDVRIISASVGTGRPLDTSLMETWRAVYRPVIDNDILLVVANGNFSSEQPQPLAVLPAHAPEFEHNWIAVTGVDVDPDSGEIDGLHPQASACGDAAQWCISAPMVLRFPSPVDDSLTELGVGTSFAAPVVSGVAAMVAGVYPWMSASNLQTTVLTTATDLGEPGVDPVFGWGMVNAEKAIQGPARFVADFHADVPDGHWVFGNAIDGAGGLVKDGTGTLELSRDNSYTGLTWIRGGQLELTGAVAGDVLNDATFLSRGAAIGGDYTATADSTTMIEVKRPLGVAGTASLDGRLHLLAPADGTDPDNSEPLLAAALVQGEFDSVTVASGFFYSATLDYTNTEVVAQLTRTSAAGAATALGLGAPARAGAQQADLLFEHLASTPPDNAGLSQAAHRLAAAPTAEHAAASLASLSGEVHATLRVAGLEHALGDAALLAERVAALGHAGAGPEGIAVATGRTGTLRDGSYARADVSGNGVLVGGHTELSDTVRGGFALSGSRMHGRLDGLAGDIRARRAGASVYARQSTGWGYLSGVVGADRISVDTRRSILVQEVLEPVSARRRDHVWHGRLEAGWAATPTLAPYAALGMLHHRQGRTEESGADGLGLRASPDRHDVGFGETGLRIDHELASGARLGGLVAGRWLVSGRNPEFRSGFAGVEGPAFAVSGQRMPGFVGRVGLQFASAERNGWRVVAEVGSELAKGGVRDSSAVLGVGWSF